MSHYVHDIPGRLRVKIPSLKGNDLGAKEVQQLIGAIEGVDSSFPSTLTGSVLIIYDPKVVSSKKILHVLKEQGYFDASKAVTHEQYVRSAASRAGAAVGRALLGFAVDKAFEGTALSFLSVLI